MSVHNHGWERVARVFSCGQSKKGVDESDSKVRRLKSLITEEMVEADTGSYDVCDSQVDLRSTRDMFGGLCPAVDSKVTASLSLKFGFLNLDVKDIKAGDVVGCLAPCYGGRKIIYDVKAIKIELEKKGISPEVSDKLLEMLGVDVSSKVYLGSKEYKLLMKLCSVYYNYHEVIQTLDYMAGITKANPEEEHKGRSERSRNPRMDLDCSSVIVKDDPSGIGVGKESSRKFNRFLLIQILKNIPWVTSRSYGTEIKKMSDPQAEQIVSNLEVKISELIKNRQEKSITSEEMFSLLKQSLQGARFVVAWRLDLGFLVTSMVPAYNADCLEARFLDLVMKTVCLKVPKYKKGDSIFEALAPDVADFSKDDSPRYRLRNSSESRSRTDLRSSQLDIKQPRIRSVSMPVDESEVTIVDIITEEEAREEMRKSVADLQRSSSMMVTQV